MQNAFMQYLVRTFGFMLVVVLAAASAVVDAQTTNDGATAGPQRALVSVIVLE